MKLASSCVSVAFAMLAPVLAQAAPDTGSPIHPLVGVALTSGGDSLAEVLYTDGGSRTIKAGNLVQIYAGAEYRAPGSPFAFQGTVGYHFDNVSAQNGSMRFERYPIELIGLWNASPSIRLGVGARYAAGARLTSGGAASIGSYDFDSSIAPLALGEWLITPHMGLQLRYVHETFKLNGYSFDGSHAGLGFNYYF